MSSESVLFSSLSFLSFFKDNRAGLTNRSLWTRFINYLQDVGFHKEKEVAFSHKQAALMKLGRDGWCAPEL